MEQALKFDAGKVELSQLPREAMEQIARVLMFGAAKYGKHNWRKGHDFTRLLDAALRHLVAWGDGETNDPESGLNHLAHAGACVAFLLWGSKHRPDLDDRPEPSPPGMLPGKTEADRVGELLRRYQLPAADSVLPGGGLIQPGGGPGMVAVAQALERTGIDASPLTGAQANDLYAVAPGVVD